MKTVPLVLIAILLLAIAGSLVAAPDNDPPCTPGEPGCDGFISPPPPSNGSMISCTPGEPGCDGVNK